MSTPRTRRVLAASTAASVAVGLLRGGVQIALYARPLAATVGLFATTTALTLLWVPVALWIATAWRWHRHRVAFAVAHVLGFVVVVCIEPLWVNECLTVVRATAQVQPYRLIFIGRFDTNSLFYIAIAAAVWVMDRARRHAEARVAAARLETVLADARLHVLTLQLHPHFLFNTLNLVSQLAYRDLSAARTTLANLRELLVQSLAQANHRDISLRDELRFLGAYIAIQQRRFGARLEVGIAASAAALDAAVPHLVLQPLVENSIAHGIGNRARGGKIQIGANVAGDRLLLTVDDDGVGPSAHPRQHGLGLANTRLRLHQLSNGDYRFAIDARTGGGTSVSIALPLRSPLHAPALTDAPGDTPGDAPVAAPAANYEIAHHTPPDSGRRSVGWLALQTIGGWAAVAMLWTELDSAGRAWMHRPLAWGTSVTSSVVSATVWALLTPLAVALARRFDFVDRRSPARLAIHAGAALITALTHVTLYLGVLRILVPSQYAVERMNTFAWGLWDIVAYATIVLFASVVTLGARRRNSSEQMATASARLASTRLASLRLRLQPSLLLAGLDAIDAQMTVDPECAEQRIARMGDLLRLLLARADHEVVSLGAELDVLRAYLDVMGSGTSIDVDAPEDAAVPALLIAPLAACLLRPCSVRIFVDGGWLVVSMESDVASVDEKCVAEIRARLQTCLGGRCVFVASARPMGSVSVRVPFTRRATVDVQEDELAELVVA